MDHYKKKPNNHINISSFKMSPDTLKNTHNLDSWMVWKMNVKFSKVINKKYISSKTNNNLKKTNMENVKIGIVVV